jgi:hypothetical protein
MTVKRIPLAALLIGSATFATADVYNNSAQWEAATSGISTINFGVLSPPHGGFLTYPSPPGLTVSGVNFTTNAPAVYVVDDAFCCATYARGSDTLDSGEDGTIVATLPANTTAVGFDLFTVTLGDLGGSLPGTVDVGVNGKTYVVDTATAPGLVFFGLTSPDAISSLTITAEQVGSGINTAVDISNFSYGGTATVTPEPGSYAALILGFGGVILAVRSRRAKQRRQQLKSFQ